MFGGVVGVYPGFTLLLDEACSLSLGIQAKLLRVIEQRDFRRVGGRCRCSAQFRIVATISEPLEDLAEAGRLRADFAFRIDGVRVRLPALRERGADVKLLAAHFLHNAGTNGHQPKRIDEAAEALLSRHRWPGNVRELKAIMERLDLLCDCPMITDSMLSSHLRTRNQDPAADELSGLLHAHDWKVATVARVLGMGRTKLYRLIEKHGLERTTATM